MEAAKKLDVSQSEVNYKELTIDEMLSSCLLFKEVTTEALEFIAEQLQSVSFRKGDPIFLENEVSDSVYFVKSGAVEILHYVPELKRLNRITVLPPGSHFSEFSVLNHSFKTASAFAYEDCELMFINGETFLKILNKFPTIPKRLALTLSEINYKLSQTHISIEDYHSVEPEFSRQIIDILPVKMWSKFGIVPLKYVAGVLYVAMTKPQDKATYQKLLQMNPRLQLVVSLVPESEVEQLEQSVSKLYKGGAVVNSASRKALSTEVKTVDTKAALKASFVFHHLSDSVMDQLVPLVEQVDFKLGEWIFEPGQESADLYVLISGEVLITKPMHDLPGHVHLVDIHPGQSFGELTLLCNQPHLHAAKAISDVKLLKVNKSLFEQLLAAPSFSVPVSRALSHRLEVMNQKHGIDLYEGDKNLHVEQFSELLPVSIVNQYKVIPMKLENEELLVGVVSSENESIYSVIARYLLDYRIRLVLIDEMFFNQLRSQIKMSSSVEGMASKQSNTSLGMQSAVGLTGRSPKIKIIAGEQDTTKIYHKLLSESFKKNASDLHIEPFESHYNVRFRVDGVLVEWEQKIDKKIGVEVINKLKVSSGLDISIIHMPQDGQLAEMVDGMDIKARVSTVPTKHGENAVLRLIRQKSSIIPLNMLAPDRRTIKILKDVTNYKQGLFLITGPTGSGKTTTLYSMLNALNSVDVNMITLENPVEMNIDGVTQIEMDEKTGLNFSLALRSVLRQDPDVVMVGEIRDAESAEIVFHAAMTGHLVLSTLHTNGSLEIFQRLSEMGVSPSTLSSGIIGGLAQRLLRANCKKCRVKVPIEPDEALTLSQELQIAAPKTLVHGRGCSLCHGTGYLGRIPVYEIWRSTKELNEAVQKGASLAELQVIAKGDGFQTLREFGLKMVLNGLTTVAEVDRCLTAV